MMRLIDPLIETYARVYTDLELDRVAELGRREGIGGRSARDAKLDLAEAIVARYHGAVVAAGERERFLRIFSAREEVDIVSDLVVRHGQIGPVDLLRLARPSASRSELRRLIGQGGVGLDGVRLTDPESPLDPPDGVVLTVGKRERFRLLRTGSPV